MTKIILGFLIAMLAGCVTTRLPRGPSEYLLSADRGAAASLRDVRKKLEENNYEIIREDLEAGLLLAKPRRFSFDKNGMKVRARQKLQISQEGGSVKIRLAYECKYERAYGACYQDDQEARAKIARLESPLLDILRPVLLRHGIEGKGGVGGPVSTDITDSPTAPPPQGY